MRALLMYLAGPDGGKMSTVSGKTADDQQGPKAAAWLERPYR